MNHYSPALFPPRKDYTFYEWMVSQLKCFHIIGQVNPISTESIDFREQEPIFIFCLSQQQARQLMKKVYETMNYKTYKMRKI